jgi:hypothetical protein
MWKGTFIDLDECPLYYSAFWPDGMAAAFLSSSG